MKLPRFCFLLLLLCASARGVDYTFPAVNQWNWVAGTDVGVPGGIDQYYPGGASARTTTTNGTTHLNVTLAPYYVNPNSPSTTGTVSAGSSTVAVASATNFRVNDVVKLVAPYPEQAQLVVTSAAAAAGNVKVAIGTPSYTNPTYNIAVLGTDAINDVAAKIRATSFTGWTTGGSGATVTFTSTVNEDMYYDLTLPSGSVAGFAATPSTVEQGSIFGVHSITAVVGNNISITPARSTALGAVGAVFKTSAYTSIQAALNDASGTGKVVYLPAGTYLIDQGLTVKTGSTLRGDGPGVTILKPDPTVTLMAKMVSLGVYFYYTGGNEQTVSGTKTKGASALTVASAAGFATGQIIAVAVESDYNHARLQAGGPLRFEVFGEKYPLTYLTKVTGVAGNVISINPPLVVDCTNVNLILRQKTNLATPVTLSGVEDMTIDGDQNTGVQTALDFSQTVQCWARNVEVKGYVNYGFHITETFQNEIRQSIAGPGRTSGTNSSGIMTDTHSCSLIVDNIIKANSSNAMENAGSAGNAWAYNISVGNTSGNDILLNHAPHNTQNLYEGNIAHSWKSDGYFGSCSHYTMLRNWWHGSNDTGTQNSFSLSANRWTRNFAMVGNVIGWNGASNGDRYWGQPNIGNAGFTGYAGPTGTSSDLNAAVGDFWVDWGSTAASLGGTMKAGGRTSDSVAVVTMSSIGTMQVGDGTFNNGPSLWWNSHGSFRKKLKITAITGLDVTFGLSTFEEGIAMPAEGTAVEVYTGQARYQELDLDVQASFSEVHQYISSATGTGVIENSTASVLPNSLIYPAKPAWFGALTWPPVNPDSMTFSLAIIPAGYRYVNAAAPPTPTPGGPTITTGSLSIGGTLSIGN